MKNNITELCFILDKSGSMSGMERDTIGGFNSMLEQQKALSGKVLVSTVLFDHNTEVIHDRVPIEHVKPMAENDYRIGGSTALLDAVGGAIRHIGNVHKSARREDVPERTMFIITTDGEENSSRFYAAGDVKTLIENQKKKYGWEFIFLGANIDAVEAASLIGIDASRAADFNCDSKGTAIYMESVSNMITSFRGNAPVTADWKARIEKDKRTRRQNR